MFSFPPEFPFVSGRKPSAAAAEPPPAPEPVVEAQPEPQQVREPLQMPEPQPVAISPPLPTQVAPRIEPKRAAPAHAERRKIKRDSLSTSALLRIDGYHGPPTKIELTDISIAGARFRCDRPMDIGEKAQIRLEVGPLRWTTRLRVIHCTRIDATHLIIGCAFLRTELLRPWPAAA